MLINNFLQSYRGLKLVSMYLSAIVLILLFSNILLAILLYKNDETIILVPPNLSKEVRLSMQKSNIGYQKAWGLFVAELIGNVSPNNVRFVRYALEPLLSTEVYQQFVNVIEVQTQAIRLDHISMHFEPKSITYEEATNLVFISGISIIKGPTGEERQIHRTYEVKFKMRDFQPFLTWVDMYEGAPQTQKVRAQKKLHESKKNKKRTS